MKPPENKIWNERWRLAALSRDDLHKIALLSVLIGLGYVLYHLQGNTTDATVFGRSVFHWLSRRWQTGGGNYSHGILIPFISLGVIWMRRHDIALAPKRISRVGLAVIVMALVLHWLGVKSQHPRASLLSLILFIWGMSYYLYGWHVARITMFPCAYLIFSIPLNFLDAITNKLKILVAIITSDIMNGLGILVVRTGSAIQAVDDTFAFDVDDPCSGLRSLLALTAIAAVYASFTQKTLLKKWALFLSSIPLAVVGNVIRILTIGLVAPMLGQDVATGIYHDYSGFIFFPVSILLLIGFGALLDMDLKAAFKKWKSHYLAGESTPAAS